MVGVFAAITDKDNRILLTKIGYGSRNWTFPGGQLEENESPIDGVKREVLEETGYVVEVNNLISTYYSSSNDNLVFLFKAAILKRIDWKPNDEIEQVQFFEREKLPEQIHPWNIKRIDDALENKISHFHIFGSAIL
ncbi:ADP-ribose pyrophosphatase YjhB (NUDIX family) [Lederbergia galactosidilyticus]|uniref:NUDIX hydrolase n=1 Tax=Lederbergia galactosidilytica TaxID=217031 RepID=UPI000716FEC2|nr:NUDIX hydrolase [Lederbergia galactosidilytica]MBP1916068.1 ADP-ribose pyrophosphatase YjhB (NUDIX family) [Lederbergia galactosidilytica]